MKMSRELLLQISEIENTEDAFRVAHTMMISLRDDLITSEQYDMLAEDLQFHCISFDIPTKNEILSLF